jgi:hypothetical protein
MALELVGSVFTILRKIYKMASEIEIEKRKGMTDDGRDCGKRQYRRGRETPCAHVCIYASM